MPAETAVARPDFVARPGRLRRRLSWILVAVSSIAYSGDPPTPTDASAATTLGDKKVNNWYSPSYWFNPATAPFLPVPEIATDPDSGTTVGLLAVKLSTDDNGQIRRIIAPDFLYNPYFGYGGHARIYDYPSTDEQWSVVAGIKERVERGVDFELQDGILRDRRWSFTYSLVYDRDGTPRFYGLGNNSPAIAQSDYTAQQEYGQARIGFNLNHTWQLLYTFLARSVDVLPGTLAGIASLETRFGRILGVGTNSELLNRASIVYDTRDNVTVPTVGMKWVAYGGLASRSGILNDSLYDEAGMDGRGYLPLGGSTVLAGHMSLRYLPDAHRLPFWALSALGGDRSDIGGSEPLRGFGPGRFYDRNSFSASAEVRQQVLDINAITTHVEIEVAPFIDVGRVFNRTSTIPLSNLHSVGGVGFRGLARPFVVGYVDVGYGSEGVAVFTGIDYPF
jgi:hypothetical protein